MTIAIAMMANSAWAACSAPAGDEGDIRYASNYNVMAFCNGVDWISMAGWNNSGGAASLLNDLSDVDTAGAAVGKIIAYNGTTWVVSDSAVGADNLGNHTATMGLNMGGFTISNTSLLSTTAGGVVSATNISATLIQAGASAATCGSSITGAIRYNSTSNTLQICNSIGWVSLVSGSTAGAATAASSTGAIQFNVANALAGDTSNLFWDDTNNRLGIGTATPSHPLEVRQSLSGTPGTYPGINIVSTTSNARATLGFGLDSAATSGWIIGQSLGLNAIKDFYIHDVTANQSRFYINTSGNVGIGTTSPAAKVQIVGDGTAAFALRISNSLVGDGIQIDTANATANNGLVWYQGNNLILNAFSDTGNGSTLRMYDSSTVTTEINASGGSSYFNTTGGNVGIGTTTPSSALTVSATSTGYAIYASSTNSSAIFGQAPNVVSTYGLQGKAGNAASGGGVIGTSQDSSAYGILGYANAYALYANGSIYSAEPAASLGLNFIANSGAGAATSNSTVNFFEYPGSAGYIDNRMYTEAIGGDSFWRVLSYSELYSIASTRGDLAFMKYNDGVGSYALYMNGGNQFVGIGTNAPAYRLDVVSSTAAVVVARFQNGTGVCTFTPASSGSGTWSCTSDARLKKDIVETGSQLDWLGSMKIKDYTMKSDGSRQTGVIAQDLIKTHPEMVHTDAKGFYMVDQPGIWKMIKVMQELKAANEKLQVHLKAANDNNAQLEQRMQRLEKAMQR